jgi:hypothetical protein
MSPDDIITKVTEASTAVEALAIMQDVPRSLLLAVADQLFIDDPDGHGSPWLRKAIVEEARA